jgi:hypothetical protein
MACSINDPRLSNSSPLYKKVVPMNRLRQWSVLAFSVIWTPVLQAQDNPASPWLIDRTLSVSPQSAPVPALRYRLIPLSTELKEGNAVPIYLRLAHEQSDAARKFWSETPKAWNALPVDKVPLEEARKFLHDYRYFLQQFELGARRRTAEWNYTLDNGDPIGLLLPDMQMMRNYTPMLILQVRAALAEGDFKAAAHHLETGFAFTRHVAEGPTLIHKLVGFALAQGFISATADFIERPDAPNLYWAITALPRPLIDQRRAEEWEYRMVEMEFPELDDLDRERTAEQWNSILQRVRTGLRNMAMGGKPPKLPAFFPKDTAPEDSAAKSPDLPEARKFVARTKNLSTEKVEAMPPAQVLLLYMMGTYHEDRDDFYRAIYLPYPQFFPVVDEAKKRLREAPISEGHVLARVLLSGLDRCTSRQVAVEIHLAALRIIEALRAHAAAHDNQLPNKLSDVTEGPIPLDPATGHPFEYSRDGDTGTLVSHIPGDPPATNGVRYHVTIRKK